MICCMYIPGSPSASILSDVASIQTRLDDLPTSQWKIGGPGSEVSILKEQKLKVCVAQDQVLEKKDTEIYMILPRSHVYTVHSLF